MARRVGGRARGVSLPLLPAGVRVLAEYFEAMPSMRIHQTAADLRAGRSLVMDGLSIWRSLYRVDTRAADAFRSFCQDDGVLFRFDPKSETAIFEETDSE